MGIVSIMGLCNNSQCCDEGDGELAVHLVNFK